MVRLHGTGPLAALTIHDSRFLNPEEIPPVTLHRITHLAWSAALLFVASGIAAGALARAWWAARTA